MTMQHWKKNWESGGIKVADTPLLRFVHTHYSNNLMFHENTELYAIDSSGYSGGERSKNMAKEFKRKMETEYISTWENLKYYIKIGKAREFFGENASMEVQVEGFGVVFFDVLDYDKEKLVDENKKHSVTLAVRDLIFEPMQFSRNGNNSWEESDIRKHINSEEFINRFEPEFRELLCEVYKDNGSRRKETIDTFFLLSVSELNGGYEFFKNEKTRVKVNDEGETDWYWTRSAYLGNACIVHSVYTSGRCDYAHAYSGRRCLPACAIAA